MLRVPLEGLKAQSKTGRCSGFRWGAPSIVSLSPRYWRIASASARGYPSLFNASGTVLFTILMTPPPTSHLYLTSAMSGSIPVVSQSIMKAIVPVGAMTDICAFLKPNRSPSDNASSQDLTAASTRSLGTSPRGILYALDRCIPMTLRKGFSLLRYPRNGPSLFAISDDVEYACPDISADMAAEDRKSTRLNSSH